MANAAERTVPPPGYIIRDQWWSRDGVHWYSDGFDIDPVVSAWAHYDRMVVIGWAAALLRRVPLPEAHLPARTEVLE